MSPQLTLQTPIQLPPSEIPSYLEQLWEKDQKGNTGANTFCLVIWQPAWLEQQLIRTGKLKGPILGTQHNDLLEASRKVVLNENLPISTAPLDKCITASLEKKDGRNITEDLRGQHIDPDISALKPRRLITLAPKIQQDSKLETTVAAYCPLLEEGNSTSACGDAIVLRGGLDALNNGLNILNELLPKELPSWLWWNGNLDEANDLLAQLALEHRRLIIDTAIGNPLNCLKLLQKRIKMGQAVSDLNWLRLRNWRESLATVFDPPQRRKELNKIVQIDIDIKGNHPVQGLLLAAWIADRLGWELKNSSKLEDDSICALFNNRDKDSIKFQLTPLPIGTPSIHPGQIVGVRLICKTNPEPKNDLCIILASESGECMRLEAGGMASMELIEEVVPRQKDSLEKDVARLLSSSRGSSSPLLSNAAPIAHKILSFAERQN